MLGDESKRQLDLFVKIKGKDPESKYDWKDVAVIGELKKSRYDGKGTLLQIGRYVRDVFANQPTRRFVHAFTLCGAEMETWVFDRSGPYSAVMFDIHEEPEKFLQVMCGYVMMSDEELGLDTFIEKKDRRLFVTIPADDAQGNKRRLELGPNALALQRAIVCRGTSCYPAKRTSANEFDCVVKFSWVSDKRPPEADLLKKADERGVKGLAKLVGHDQVTTISALRDGLKFSKPYRFRSAPRSASSSFSQLQSQSRQSRSQLIKMNSVGAETTTLKRSRSNMQRDEAEPVENNITFPVLKSQGASLVELNDIPFDNRILRVLAISPAGRVVTRFDSIVELLKGLRDAIKVHRSLYIDGKILHRDISENNIILTDPAKAEGFTGMLIDLDLAKELGKGSSGTRHRTGTMEFMAIEVLLGLSHTYRHDLESFFYVLIWLCARRGWRSLGNPEGRPEDSLLQGWYMGTYKEIARNKRGDMDKRGFVRVMEEFPPFFDSVKPLCKTIRDILFPYRDGLFTGTPYDPEILYTPIIEAFEEALMTIQEEEDENVVI